MTMGNKAALVTGAGTGIGRALALELAKVGYDVALHCNGSVDGAISAASEIRDTGRKAAVIKADLSRSGEPERLFSEYRAHFGTLDLFVNNAGVTLTAPFLNTTEEIFDKVCGVDFKGAYFCIQNAGCMMKDQEKPGSIAVIASNHAETQFANSSVYGSVKAALVKLTRHAALELAKYRIRVNSVAPGWTDTGAARLGDKESTYYKIPLKRWVTPEEIAHAVLFLASDYAASITGACLIMDGGAVLLSDRAENYGL